MGEWAENGLVGLVTPTLILGVPLFDIAFVGTVRVVFLIFSISTTLGLSAMLLEHATPPQAVLILLQAICVLMLIAVLETVGRGRGR